jgi:hypothetical protein
MSKPGPISATLPRSVGRSDRDRARQVRRSAGSTADRLRSEHTSIPRHGLASSTRRCGRPLTGVRSPRLLVGPRRRRIGGSPSDRHLHDEGTRTVASPLLLFEPFGARSRALPDRRLPARRRRALHRAMHSPHTPPTRPPISAIRISARCQSAQPGREAGHDGDRPDAVRAQGMAQLAQLTWHRREPERRSERVPWQRVVSGDLLSATASRCIQAVDSLRRTVTAAATLLTA